LVLLILSLLFLIFQFFVFKQFILGLTNLKILCTNGNIMSFNSFIIFFFLTLNVQDQTWNILNVFSYLFFVFLCFFILLVYFFQFVFHHVQRLLFLSLLRHQLRSKLFIDIFGEGKFSCCFLRNSWPSQFLRLQIDFYF
jgi:hypothetical protein